MERYAYLRVSSKSQTIMNQRKLIEDSSYKVDTWIEEGGVSGTIMCLDRPAFKAMTQSMKEGDEVCVSALDRLGRNAADILKTVEAFIELKVKVRILAFDNVDVTSAFGKMFIGMLAVFAELDRNQIVDRVNSGIARVKKEGMILGKSVTITPETMVAICDSRKQGMSLDAIQKAHGVDRQTANRNILKWGGKLSEYATAYHARQGQNATQKEKKIAALNKVKM